MCMWLKRVSSAIYVHSYIDIFVVAKKMSAKQFIEIDSNVLELKTKYI